MERHGMKQDIHPDDRVQFETRCDNGWLYMEQGVVLYKIDLGTFAVLHDDEYYCVRLDNGSVIDCPARVLRLVRPLRVYRP